MFLKDCWYIAATSSELGRSLLARKLLGEPLLLYRTQDGRPTALRDTCPHRQYPLSRGKLIGDNVQCGYHGLTYAPSGKCVHIPGQPNIPPRAKVQTYPVVEKWRWIWVWMGDSAKADPSLIPAMFSSNEDPAWAPTNGYLHIGCHYQLLIDNLLDLSHAAFVHPSTIGDVNVAETPPEVKADGHKVTLERRVFGVEPAPFFRSLHGYEGKIDRMHRIEFTPPSNIVILSSCAPAGANDFDSERALKYFVLNGISPASENEVHHFWAVNRNFLLDDEKLTAGFEEQSRRTFAEDIDVLEAQQQRIELEGSMRWLDVNNDKAGVAARKVIASLAQTPAV